MANNDVQVNKIMKNLGLSREEALQMLADDKAIDRGQRMEFDLSPEAEKQAKKLANVGTRKKPTVYDFKKPRERKINTTKREIINYLMECLGDTDYENLTLANPEREITFDTNGKNYSITLIEHRPKKG